MRSANILSYLDWIMFMVERICCKIGNKFIVIITHCHIERYIEGSHDPSIQS